MKTTRRGKILIAFLLTFCMSYTKGDPCGGVFVSDAGEFDLPSNKNSNVGLECVWIIQLLSRSTVNFTLNRLDSTSATVSLYPEHEASETVLTPIRLSSSDIGQTSQTLGQTLIVILISSDSSTGLSFEWNFGSLASSEVLTAVSYVDSGEGRILWKCFNPQERLTWALNLQSTYQNSFALEAEIHFGGCELLNPCWCSYFGIYEVLSTGDLQEVTRVCGRSLSFNAEQLHPKLVAFVYINSTASVTGTDYVELTWAPQRSATEDPGQTSEATTTTTTKPPPVCSPEKYPGYNATFLECGGLIEIPNLPSASAYLVQYEKMARRTDDPQEHCLWTFNNIKDEQSVLLKVKVTLLCEGPSDLNTSLSVLNWTTIDKDFVLGSHDLSGSSSTYATWSDSWDLKLFLSYTSPRNSGSGFLALIEVIQATMYSSASFLYFKTSTGSQTFGPFAQNHRFSLVVNPQQTQTNFTVNYLDSNVTECFLYDMLDVYEIRPKAQPRRLDRLCGNVTSPRSYISTFPFIATFETLASTTGNGFQVSWK